MARPRQLVRKAELKKVVKQLTDEQLDRLYRQLNRPRPEREEQANDDELTLGKMLKEFAKDQAK